MDLTITQLAKFLAGQLTVLYYNQDCTICCEIKDIEIRDGRIFVQPAWLAKSAQCPPDGKWIKAENAVIEICLEFCAVSVSAEVSISVPIEGYEAVFSLKSERSLLPSQVAGLDIPSSVH